MLKSTWAGSITCWCSFDSGVTGAFHKIDVIMSKEHYIAILMHYPKTSVKA